MIKLVNIEQIQGTYEGKPMDFDRYNIDVKTALSTKEYSVVIDFVHEEISGDCIAYGSWFDIDKEECVELAEAVLKENKAKRNFDYILEKEKGELTK